jgi:hypothetical protein
MIDQVDVFGNCTDEIRMWQVVPHRGAAMDPNGVIIGAISSNFLFHLEAMGIYPYPKWSTWSTYKKPWEITMFN